MAKLDASVYLYLTTIGRYSGEPREIEIWFTLIEGTYYVIAELGDDANWVKNIRRNPTVTFRIGEMQYTGQARIIDDDLEPALAELVREQSEAKYGWGDGLVVALPPDPTL